MRGEAEHAELVFAVERLRQIREERNGRLPAGWIDEMAASCGVGRSTLLRYIAKGVPELPARGTGWRWGSAARAAYYRAAGDVTLARRLMIESQGARSVPSLSTMYRTLERDLAPDERELARRGEAAARGKRLVVAVEDAHRNATWLSDHKQLDIAVLPPRGSNALRPWMTVIIDGYSRRAVGASLSVNANRGHVMAALGMAIRQCGVPRSLVFDRGREFLSHAVRDHAGALGYAAYPTLAYHPHHKGKVERFHQTMNRLLTHELATTPSPARRIRGERLLGGTAVVPLEAMVERFYAALAVYNTERTSRAVDGRTPQGAYDADDTPERRVPDELLRRFLLAEERRKVSEYGIQFRKRHYWAPELEGHRGDSVEVRFAQDDQRTIELFRDDRHWCTAALVDPASPEQRDQVLQSRRVHASRAKGDLRRARRQEKRAYVAITDRQGVEESTVVTREEHSTETAGASASMRAALEDLGLRTDLDSPIEGSP